MLTLIAEVIPLAIAGAISPVVLMGALAILDGPRAVLQSAAFSVGVVGTTVVLFVIGYLVTVAQRDGDSPGWFASDQMHIALGLVLIVAGLILGTVRPDPQRMQQLEERFLLGARSLRGFVVAGIALMITNASTFVMLIAILHAVARADVLFAEATLALAVATFIVVLPATAPLAAAILGGARLRARLGQISRLSTRYGRFVMAVLWIAFGVRDVLAVVLG